jgi:hypothetical protein
MHPRRKPLPSSGTETPSSKAVLRSSGGLNPPRRALMPSWACHTPSPQPPVGIVSVCVIISFPELHVIYKVQRLASAI